MTAEALIILVGDDPAALEQIVEPVWRRLARAGWSRRISDPYIQVFSPTSGRLAVTRGLDGHGVLVGDIFDRSGVALSEVARGSIACRPLDASQARKVVAECWGRYLVVRRVSGDVAVLRDPSGAVEAVGWRKRGVTLISTAAEAILDPWLPDDVSIDWDGVKDLVGAPGEHRHDLALEGLTAVAAGELRVIGPWGSRGEQIWRPAEIYRSGRQAERLDLRAVVERSVQTLAGAHRWVAEVSGGLDSAIVAAALTPDQRENVTAWVNHYVDQPEGDERQYARPVVEKHGFILTEVRREGLRLDAARLSRSAEGFRPAINDIDPDYNDDIADRIEATGAWGSLTGQGGDAVFFQMPTPLIAFDEVWERGMSFRPAVAHRIARWTRRSLWPTGWIRAWRAHGAVQRAWDHPWLDDLRAVPPAKALQISILAFCQTYQGQAVRSRAGACVNPLLSQPVMEAGLSLSAVDLTWGGRDRSAAREAFVDVLPPAIFSRRSKGELGTYYGQAVAGRLDFLRDYLLGGVLADAGLISADLEEGMTRETLLWRGGFSQLLSLALTEAWARRWRERLAARRV